MDTNQLIAVMQAYLAGQAVEARVIGFEEWVDVGPNYTVWNAEEYEYRVKPLDHDAFDWSAASPGFKWLARDLDGQAYLYVAAPYKSGGRWMLDSRICTRVSARNFSSYAPGPRDWKDSLQGRTE